MASGVNLNEATNHKNVTTLPMSLYIKDLVQTVDAGLDDHTLHQLCTLDDLGQAIIPARMRTFQVHLHASSSSAPLAAARAVVSEFVT